MENNSGKGEPFPQKRSFTRYNYSFRARLIQSPLKVQSYYAALLTAARGSSQLRVTYGWRQVYIHIRRRQVAQLVFKGHTLCIAFAIDPAEGSANGHRVEDVSRYKRFAKTPLMVRLVSRLRLRSALVLLEQASGIRPLPRADMLEQPLCDYQTTEELIACGLIKVLSLAAAEEGQAHEEGEAE